MFLLGSEMGEAGVYSQYASVPVESIMLQRRPLAVVSSPG